VQVQLHPHHLPLLAALCEHVREASAASSSAAPETGQAGGVGGVEGTVSEHDPAAFGRRSVLEELLMPDCEGMVADALSLSTRFIMPHKPPGLCLAQRAFAGCMFFILPQLQNARPHGLNLKP
jgi:hypothetical protein